MEKVRNNGIDLLRILAMCGIIGLHVLNNGGVLANLSYKSCNYYIVLLFTCLCYTSVNIFGIITGWLYSDRKKLNNSRIIELWTIVLFYCFVIPSIFYIFNLYDVRKLGIKEMIKNYFPVLDGRYWYIVCYTFVFFLIPYINIFINSLNKEKYIKFLIIVFILLSLLPNVFFLVDFFKTDNGYSPFWLIYLYMIGAYIKKYININEIKKVNVKIIVSLLGAFILNLLVKIVTNKIFGHTVNEEWFINYISPFIISASIYIVIKFISLNMKEYKTIKFLSSFAFAVYIIHSQILIFKYVLGNQFAFLNYKSGLIIVGCVIFIIISIYIICMLIDIFRKWIFNILKIDKIINWIGNKIDKFYIEN